MAHLPNLLPALDLIDTFRFWLHTTLPEWEISEPTIASEGTADRQPVFALLHQGIPVGSFSTPLQALERIGDEEATATYLGLVAED